ncbi:MAG: TraX protein [Oscillospiraceae bacterium]|nr:TraX protein [Oscillospiraceae bacterium]
MKTKKYKILSGSVLKLIALITMLIDHTTLWIMTLYPLAERQVFLFSDSVTFYILGRAIGRIAFPIYCFLIAEGCRYTHDRKKYGIRLLAFAFISELPWNLLHGNSWFYPQMQNVFFTLFLGFCCIVVYDRYRKDAVSLIAGLLILILTSLAFHADYGIRGMALILMLYLLRERRILQGFFGCCFLNEGAATLPAFFAIGLYNGERGFIRGRIAKYMFYAFYPLHLLVLYLIRQRIGTG